ncbi:MAG: Spy/CpxP family protein refolding chaperone [Candidatus Omnitrophica bacterium]|nr:Spy/CpxP family protein refolding chaperone [Candidatus Omnitrophota bacterium]
MDKKFLLIMLFAGIFLWLSPLANAQMPPNEDVMDSEGMGPGMEHKGKGGKHFDEMKKELGLSEEQIKALDANREAKKTEIKALHEKMKTAQKELKIELDKPVSDEAKIKNAEEQLKQAFTEMTEHRVKAILEIKKILTPEQFEKFTKNMEEKKEQWKNKKGSANGKMREHVKENSEK